MAGDYGYLLPAGSAAKVLAAANITKYTPVGEGEKITYNGVEHWILQREVDYGPDANSPDGVHLVYAPSQVDIYDSSPKSMGVFDTFISALTGAPLPIEPAPGQESTLGSFFTSLKDLIILGLVVYAGVNVLGFFKDRK
jgi:hypothetical protein